MAWQGGFTFRPAYTHTHTHTHTPQMKIEGIRQVLTQVYRSVPGRIV